MGSMRVQTACNLTVRLTWDVADGHDHPRETFGCVQDEDMAITMAQYSAGSAPDFRRLVRVETSPSAGRYHPWAILDLS